MTSSIKEPAKIYLPAAPGLEALVILDAPFMCACNSNLETDALDRIVTLPVIGWHSDPMKPARGGEAIFPCSGEMGVLSYSLHLGHGRYLGADCQILTEKEARKGMAQAIVRHVRRKAKKEE